MITAKMIEAKYFIFVCYLDDLVILGLLDHVSDHAHFWKLSEGFQPDYLADYYLDDGHSHYKLTLDSNISPL